MELERILFMEGKDGTDGAVAFCKQGMIQYGQALRERPKTYARDPLYRKSFVQSMVAYRKYLMQHFAYYYHDAYRREVALQQELLPS